jgi:hypothetical protein
MVEVKLSDVSAWTGVVGSRDYSHIMSRELSDRIRNMITVNSWIIVFGKVFDSVPDSSHDMPTIGAVAVIHPTSGARVSGSGR